MQNIKDKIFALSPAILFLIGITILGGTVAGGVYIFKTTRNTCTGANCVRRTATTTPFNFNEPDKISQIEDVCGDGICGTNEGLYQNVCPRDCGGVAIPPTIDSFVARPDTIKAGKTTTLSWSSDAIFCAPADEGSPWGGRWSGGAPKGEMVTNPLFSDQFYSITCMSNNGGMAKESVAVSVIQPPPIVKKVVKKEVAISFTATPDTINSGKTAKLSWSSINATTCSAGGDGASWGWSGIRPTAGNQVTPPLTSNQTYTIKCTGNDGSASKKVTVNVSSLATAPYLSFNALPDAIPYGEKATLAWIISDAESCTTSNSGEYPEWTGPLPSKSLFGGLKSTRALTLDQTFTITCTNGTGTATATTVKSVAIAVSAPSSCTLSPWGEIQSGSSIDAYLTSTVAYGETCASEKRNCLNGKLSGSYTNQSCKPAEGRGCSLGGTTIKAGETITAYKETTSPLTYGTSCPSEVRKCEDGTLTGSYTKQNCDTVNYDIPGIYAFIVPQGATKITVEGWAGGGGGGGSSNMSAYQNYGGGGGGGSGEYGKNTYSVVPGTNYSVIVGAEGAGGVFGGSSGSSGGATSFGDLLHFAGGNGGGGANTGGSGGGGVGGGSSGMSGNHGSNGATGSCSGGSVGGTGGKSGYNNTNSGAGGVSGGAGGNGTYGSGGGGGSAGWCTNAGGGKGGDGGVIVKITY